MKKMLSLILCLCLAASLLMGLSAQAGAETPPEERDLIILFTSDVHCAVDQGDGYTMFDGAKVLQTGEKYNFEVIYRYLTETLGGRVGAGYENPYGDGRIVFVSPES